MNLAHDYPDMAASARQRIELTLSNMNCFCQSNVATLTKRRTSRPKGAQLQCCGCFRSLGSFMSGRDHPDIDTYPDFLDDTAIQGKAEYEEKASEEGKRAFADFVGAAPPRKAEYQQFLLSPEWRSLRALVLRRAHGLCECGLVEAAAHVHHSTYDYGWLPPAWPLRAVCEKRHADVHAIEDYPYHKRREVADTDHLLGVTAP